MSGQILLYLGSIFILFWGVAHLFPTRSVVKNFGDISRDNQLIITMEWIGEGVALIFIGVLVAAVTFIDYHSPVSMAVYRIVFIVLNLLSIISFFTGFRIEFLPFKMCPIIFSTASVLFIVGAYL